MRGAKGFLGRLSDIFNIILRRESFATPIMSYRELSTVEAFSWQLLIVVAIDVSTAFITIALFVSNFVGSNGPADGYLACCLK